MFEFHSIITSARDNRNAYSTGKYWLIKVFEVLKDIPDNVILEGIIYIDEILFPVIKSKEVIKDGKKLNLTQKVYKTEDTKGLSDEENPLYKINHLHSLIKRFMKAHGGFNRDDLQDWMNLICFILSKPFDRYDKIKEFIEIAIYTPSRVKYRDVMSKKAR